MTKSDFRFLTHSIATIIAAIVAFGITYLDSKYFLMGVEVERGYEAVGGEYIFLVLIFGGMYYSIKHILVKLFRNILFDILTYDED